MADAKTVIDRLGLSLAPEELEALIRGVLCAPTGEHPTRWVTLVKPGADDAEIAALQELKATIARELDSGLGVAPAPADRLVALRAELRSRGVDGFLVPRGDEFHNEYPPRRADRLEWLTGFNGSAGLAAVFPKVAAIFVDGRYTLQASQQVDGLQFEQRHLVDAPVEQWVLQHGEKGQKLGVDPWLHTQADLEPVLKACEARGVELVRLPDNPIDAVWTRQPDAPIAPLRVHPLDRAGQSVDEKRRIIAEALDEQGAQATVLTATDSVAWLTNLRGGDLPHTPAFLAYAILTREEHLTLFVDLRKVTDEVRAHLERVELESIDGFAAAVASIAAERVLLDEHMTPVAVIDLVREAGATPVLARDPVMLPKARKNPAELKGTRAAHRRDGAAVTKFLRWVTEAALERQLGELEAAAKLLEFRRQNELFEDLSFETITGAGPNGAIIHYRATPASERILERNSIYLVDSGAQYLDGTTDITRTVAIGEPTDEHRARFTRVLKGHIALARAVFPKGTTGSQIDAFARQALWEAGLDYDHGTGHGVGSYLGVHEGPQRIANRPNTVPLEPGMICSNEPGYYKEGGYGIRIENLVVVREVEIEGAERTMYGFETLTLAPIDRRLIETKLLTQEELRWLNAYHARVCETIAPLVDHETAKWLREVTEPVGR